MKLKKILAAVAAAAVAVSMTAVNSFAAVFETSIDANGAPNPNYYYVPGIDGVDYSKVAKIEAVVSTSDYVNGTIGVSCGGTWTTPGQVEVSGGGTATWTLDGLSGIDATDDAGAFKADAVQIQFWWLNAGSLSLESVKLFDADGNVLQEAGAPAADEAAPADDTAADEAAPADDTTAAEADDADVAVDDEDVDDDADADIVDTDDDADVADTDDDAAADTSDDTAAVADTSAPAADTTTAAAATGNVAVASIVTVMAVAGAAAIVAKKRK